MTGIRLSRSVHELEHLLTHPSDGLAAGVGEVAAAVARTFRFTECALHRVERTPAQRWTVAFAHQVGFSAATWNGFLDDYLASAPIDWACYNPLLPERRQRNRALRLHSERDELRLTETSRGTLGRLFPSGLDGRDQLRLLSCDGPRLLGWVGGFRDEPFSDAEARALQRLAPALQSWLFRERWSRQLATLELGFEAALDAFGAHALIVDRHGRILFASSAAQQEAASRQAHLSWLMDVSDLGDWTTSTISGAGMPELRLLLRKGPPTTVQQRITRFGDAHRLTRRQREVLARLVLGDANKLIAEHLDCAEGTVEAHLSALYRRANVSGRAQLLALFWSWPT